MKHTRFALAFAMTSLAAAPSLAASMTMVQFGSFETREEAEKRLDDMKSKYSAKIAGIPASVREVKLPPDNLTVYRTQAGPVENRAAAQSICTQLASAGDECYIVQTAMLPQSTPVAVAAPATAPAPAKATSVLAAPVESVLAPATPENDGGEGSSITSKLESLKDVPARDPSNREALASLTTAAAPAASEAPPETISDVPAASPELSAALDKAVAEKDTAPAAVDATTLAEKSESKPTRSFWQRLNPFSGDSDAAPAAAAVAVPAAAVAVASASEQDAAPVVPVAVAPLKEAKEDTKEAASVEPETAQDAAPIVVTRAPIVVTTAPATALDQAPTAMRLPPPPAPLKAADRALLNAPKAPTPAPEPITSALLNPPEVLATGNGSVKVEEAKRVPVTQNEAPPPAPAAAPVATPVASQLQPPVSLVPSSTNGVKTIWAQIGPFTDNTTALNFWANYRQAHPDFPVVRVRVTTPYQQKLRGSNQAWLRVGPVARAGFINSLCTSLPSEAKLNCGHVTDLGIAVPPSEWKGMLPSSRYQR